MRHFAVVAMTGSDSIYSLRNKADNRVKWKEAVDFLMEKALEELKRIDAEGAILRAERNVTAAARRQEILAGEGPPVRGRGRPRGSRGRGRGRGRGVADGGDVQPVRGRGRGRPRGVRGGRNGRVVAGRGGEAEAGGEQPIRGRGRGRPKGIRGRRRARG